MRSDLARAEERRQQLRAVIVSVEELERLRSERENLAAIVEQLTQARGEQTPAVLLWDVARAPEWAALQIETLWAHDSFFEVTGKARGIRADVERAGQALERRGRLESFDVWRFDADGTFALLGRVPAGAPRRALETGGRQ
jgi:hypothetical protein